jgi:hypothetical protein
MNKKVWFVCLGSMVAGLAAGYFVDIIHATSIMAKGMLLQKEIALNQSGSAAFEAYQHESRLVAIYALTQDLSTLQDTEQLIDDPAQPLHVEIEYHMMLVHSRLAKLDFGTNEISKALECAQATGRFLSITNETQLFELLAKCDQKGDY